MRKWSQTKQRLLAAGLTFFTLVYLLVLYKEEVSELQYLFTIPSVALLPNLSLPRVVVSMTTFSDRIFVTGMHAIHSVIAQRQPYDRFIITIPVRGTRQGVAPGAPSVTTICAYWTDCVPISANGGSSSDNASTADSIIHRIITFLEAPEQGLGEGRFILATTTASPSSPRAIYENARHRMTLQFLLDSDPYGPATKVLGALLLERDPQTVVITVDDDISYDLSLLHVLSTHIPSHAALCPACQTRSLLSPDTGAKGMIHDGSWHRWFWNHNAKPCPGWLVGWAGVAYRVGYFGSDVFNLTTMPSTCFLNDDVWLSGYLRRRGIGLLVMPGIRGGRQFRHPTLSLSVRPDYESEDMDPCIRFWEGA